MDNRFDNVHTHTFSHITKTAYFKLALADLLSKINKVIYLDSDSDIIVHQDLYNSYNLNFNNANNCHLNLPITYFLTNNT